MALRLRPVVPAFLQRELVRRFTFGFGPIVHRLNQIHVALALLDFPTREHPGLSVDHHVGWQQRSLTKQASVVDVAGHVAGNESIQHAANADHFAGEDACVDSGLRVVTHHAAQELHSGRHLAIAIFDVDLAIRVLQVAIAGSRPKVDPTAQVAVPQESVVLLVRVGLNHRRFDLPADFDRVPQ